MNMKHLIVEMQSLLRRRGYLMLRIIGLGILASLFVATNKPRLYEASAVIQIEQPSIQDPSATSESLNNATLQMIQIIEQRVMARDNLLRIVDEFDLYADLENPTDAEKVYLLRLAAEVSRIQISDASMRWSPTLRPTALRVTVEMDDPALAAAVANELVANVLDQNNNRRTERVRETLAFFEGEEQRIGDAISDLEGQIATFKRENEDSLPAGLSEKRTRLTELRQVELEIDGEILGLKSGRDPRAGSVLAKSVQRLEEQRDLYRAEADEVAAAIAEGPRVEQRLNMMQRQLQKLTGQYLAISSSGAEAEMGQMLEASQQTESFQVLERALPPENSAAQGRKRTVALGAMVSIGLAAAIVFLLEIRNPVIWTAAQLERQLNYRPIVSIPVIELPRERWVKRTRSLGLMAGILAVFIAAAFLILSRSS